MSEWSWRPGQTVLLSHRQVKGALQVARYLALTQAILFAVNRAWISKTDHNISKAELAKVIESKWTIKVLFVLGILYMTSAQPIFYAK